MLQRRKLAWTALFFLAALAVYGFFHERLFAQHMWSLQGGRRFLIYTAIFWAASALLLWAAPRWLGVAAAGFVLVYTVWWSGPGAVGAVLYFLGACFLTGRIFWRHADGATAMLLGLAVWMFAIWIALHFRVNTRAAYAAAMAVPYVWEARRLGGYVRDFRFLCDSRKEAAGLALLLFLLMAHWLVALKPEISADGISMHLALPTSVAYDAQWAFDFHRYTWALMPAGGDFVFTAAYLLGGSQGGEAAAHLTNFALLVLMAAMVAKASRQWLGLPTGRAFLVAAMFASTPLVQLVTGSLFVENVWAAMILGASLAIARYREAGDAAELRTAGALFGAALAVKLIAALFLIPAAFLSIWIALRRKDLRPLLAAALLLAIMAAPPYLNAFIKSGNPVFPFANSVFRSPYFDANASFIDGRFSVPLSWRTPYDAVFRSRIFFEGQSGAGGFQYLLLLIPAALLVRRREVWLLLAIAGMGTLLVFAVLHNLRYLYPALPLFSIAIGSLFAGDGAFLVPLAVALTALNVWFLPSSGWYHRDFALFRRAEIGQLVETAAPERNLIEYLNRAAPGQPVAFFSSDGIAGLHAQGYADTWHTYEYSRLLTGARSTAEVAAILRERGIGHIIAPRSLKTGVPLRDTFLREWAEPDSGARGLAKGRAGLFRLREAPVDIRGELQPFPAGAYDDLDDQIEYTGAWIHDNQFVKPLAGSVTYSNVAGDSLRFAFVGAGVTYIFTGATNRGVARVLIDGKVRADIDLYSPGTVWQSERSFDGLGAGTHTFELRVLGKKGPESSGTYVDLDGVVVR